MAWTLEIHHIDVFQGDATLVVARYDDGIPAHNVTRAVLIDGGKRRGAARIDAYLQTLGIASVYAVAITHYDDDHYQGITELINTTNRLNTALIYDQGKPPSTTIQGKSSKSPFSNNKRGRRTSPYEKYLEAIQNKQNANVANTLRRVTTTINSFSIVNFNGNGDPILPGVANYREPNDLIGRDILWGNGDLANWQANPPQPGAPTVVCIAANKWVNSGGVNHTFPNQISIFDGLNRVPDWKLDDDQNNDDNAKSLGFLVRFGNFKYYVGGDMTSVQEDGANNVNNGVMPFVAGLQPLLNLANDFAGRLHAMKASHHGSNVSTSAAFLNCVRPVAVFISAGAHKSTKLPPVPGLITRLDNANVGNANIVQRYYLTNKPPHIVVGANAIVPGPAANQQRTGNGHLKITVTAVNAAIASTNPHPVTGVITSTPFQVTYTDAANAVINVNH